MHTACMMLLRFTVENHRCFRDEVTLELVSSTLKTQRPAAGGWLDHLHPVAGIFGANASGKSSVLDAMAFAREAVRSSASEWLAYKRTPHVPFRLDGRQPQAPSRYRFDIIIDGVRCEYGFGVTAAGIESEWLVDYPNGRRRLLFDRLAGRDDVFDFGRALTRPAAVAAAVSPRELLLSRGALLGHPQLSKVARALTEELDLALFGEPHQQQRIQAIIDALLEGSTSFDEIVTLLRVADIGIERVALREEEVPEPLRRLLRALNESISPPSADGEEDGEQLAVSEVRHRLEFYHAGQSDGDRALGLGDESSGTISWLSLAVPAVEALRRGSVLLIDEIDASLHPQLSSLLIGMFLDRDINRRGAQLVFTSHDTFLLTPGSEAPLHAEQVWFTEKGVDGASDLYCLAEFTHRTTDNVARRYLAGRYGAVPRLAPSLLRGLFEASPKEG